MTCNKLIWGAIMTAAMILIAATGWAEKDCEYNGVVYSAGSFTCQSGYGYTCKDGSWDLLNTACSSQPHESSADKAAIVKKGICGCSKEESNFCFAAGRVCSSEGDAGRCVKKCK